MEQDDAMQFYERITQGKDRFKQITLEHHEGFELSGVRMHAIDKKSLAGVIERLPEEMFEAVEGAEDADEAEEELEEQGGNLNAVTEDTVEAFEDLISESLDHPDLAPAQIETIAEELNFETLFELGTEIINMSVEDTGSIQGFHEQG